MSILAFNKYPLLEKTILVGLVTSIFMQLLPNAQASVPDILVSTGVIIVISSLTSSWLRDRGKTWAHSGARLLVLSP